MHYARRPTHSYCMLVYDPISEIDGLYKARQRLRDDFKKYQSEYLTANSRQETEERERESVRRGEERKERRKRQ